MLGIEVHASSTLGKLGATLRHLGQTSLATLAVAAAVLAVLVVGERLLPKAPVALVAVVGSIVVAWAADLPSHGVAIVGHVPGGLPSLGLPDVGAGTLGSLGGIALSIFVIVLAQSAATSSSFAAKYGEVADTNQDLVGLGVANVAAGLSGTFVVNGSPTKTAVVDTAGGRSQLAQLTMGLTVLMIVLVLTKPLGWLPEAALAAVVFRIAIGLVDGRTILQIRHVRLDEFLVVLLTAGTVVVLGVEQGIILAVAASLIIHVRRDYEPHDSVMVVEEGGGLMPTHVASGVQSLPGLIVYRFGSGLFFANTARFEREVKELVDTAPSPVRCVVIDASALSDIDYSAGEMLGELERALAARGVTLVFASMDASVRHQLDAYDTLPVGPSGSSPFYARVREAIDAFRAGPT
jgi:MFS superfamily sulfate permease-like transporter